MRTPPWEIIFTHSHTQFFKYIVIFKQNHHPHPTVPSSHPQHPTNSVSENGGLPTHLWPLNFITLGVTPMKIWWLIAGFKEYRHPPKSWSSSTSNGKSMVIGYPLVFWRSYGKLPVCRSFTYQNIAKSVVAIISPIQHPTFNRQQVTHVIGHISHGGQLSSFAILGSVAVVFCCRFLIPTVPRIRVATTKFKASFVWFFKGTGYCNVH